MDTVILGGDERFACLARLLENRGHAVARLRGAEELHGALTSANNVVTNCPAQLRGGVDWDALLAMLPPNATLWLCGPGAPENLPEGRRAVDLWRDEALLVENAGLTAEGAILAAMSASRRSLRELPAMVIGWGRIGKALTERLEALGCKVTVASRSDAHRRRALASGADAADTDYLADALPGRKLILNTAPAMILEGEALERVDRDALIIDLASPPYGIDLTAAWARGLRAWREPALPGRCFPESAAAALLRAMDRAGKGERAWAD